MPSAERQLLIMIAGPYTSGGAGPAQRERNLHLLNEAAVKVWEKGHVPLIGVNAVKPVIDAAGEGRYAEMMMPMCLVLAERCDAVLRIGGASTGADQEMECVAAKGGFVFRHVDEIPSVA
ncbi:MAG: DUF4406 domain-containing protein [Rhodospirillaceae bacterium]|nr:DUF4406 domain-containing protein [Rhodospirillaceae bacterium]